MKPKITKKQEEVLTYIKKYIVKYGYPPSVREICSGLGLSSPATVHTHLTQLEIKGAIKKTASKFRTIEVTGENEYAPKDEEIVKVPLLGKVTAGNPIEAIENPDELFSLPASLIPRKKSIFTLKVSGDSMINVGIYDNDIVIVQKQKEAQNGDIVVAMNEENEVTLKTFYKEKNYIRLQPENDHLEPIILNNVTIIGKAIGLYRKL
ncbi:MAG: transcriptional repressor LexA [Bacilli bacterium]|nr:transcriptional repressor LexA [Bacilli bacterium]MDD3895509.1 transcriptional repressor LexA [Bacilli bacterium]MDD4407563.1 transcriptional repressor LexA [Bacilli bacterium]